MQGRLPIEVFLKSGLPKLKALDLRQNNFDYDAAALEPLIARCIRGRTSADEREISIIRCFGLPPDSCSAFGNEYRVSTLEPALCVRCADPLITLIVVSSILVAFVLALVAYVYFISRYPRALRRWVSSVSIVVTHIQTLSIISQVFRLRINPPFFCFRITPPCFVSESPPPMFSSQNHPPHVLSQNHPIPSHMSPSPPSPPHRLLIPPF